jgi:ATP-dependent helicase Lhr and Lhr-like helicase
VSGSVFGRFAPRLQQAIVARLGWSRLRQVQDLASAALLDGHNAVILAPTAGGKTEAAIFPTLSALIDDPTPTSSIGALYIAPIKALLNNQADRLGLYTEMVGLRRFVWHGDTTAPHRRAFLQDPADLLMTTPESLEVMLVSPRIDHKALFGSLRVVIIDEIHALAGSDRGAHLLSVIERLQAISQHDLQRVGLSATVGNPADILTWIQGTSRRRGVIIDPPKTPSPRHLRVIHRADLGALARVASRAAKGKKSLFFCQSRATTELVAEHMRASGTTVFVHHSAVSREERAAAEARFNHGADACIVCTSTLELGIDVGDLDSVFQSEAPDTVSAFLQRMGRTGRRAGQPANTTFFCETTEGVLQSVALIALARSGWVESIDINARCWPVLIHQLFALALAAQGITPDSAWAQLARVPDLQGITHAEWERLLAWLIKAKALAFASGRLVLGTEAERRFGRRNFMELFAVFSSPKTYAVLTVSGQPLGTLNQGFVDQLVPGVSCFLLGGRPRAVVQLHHDSRRVIVEPAAGGRQPTWGGALPMVLGFDLCRKIREVLMSADVPPYLDASAAQVLAAQRALHQPTLADGDVEAMEGELRWWTFAGGKVNATLRHALAAICGDVKITADNYAVRLRGEGVNGALLTELLEKLRQPTLWVQPAFWREVAELLPSYRLSKFQVFMPDWVTQEVVARFLLDLPRARAVIG